MKFSRVSIFMLVLLSVLVAQLGEISPSYAHPLKSDAEVKVARASFPKGFVFGTATAAYQYEGAAFEDGKGPSIWDTFTHIQGHIVKNENGDIAVDQYHRFEEDVYLMKDINMDAYRFSISWPRILPDGKWPVNKEGVDYYNNLIDSLLAHGIEPYVTLYHWDLPQALETSIGGWLSEDIVEIFGQYAWLCFELFGDRVKHWITFNEIHSFVGGGYFSGLFPPGRCSSSGGNCTHGNSDTEPFIVAHNALNAHALAVSIYRTSFQDVQRGIIGLTADCTWYEPLTNSTKDKNAAQSLVEGFLGWLLDPIFFGDYPASMRDTMGSRLPTFTREQTNLIKGSHDFIGLNHYTSNYASQNSSNGDAVKTEYRDGVIIGPQAASDWLFIVPYGMEKLLSWIRERYNNPVLYITENGVDEANTEDTLSLTRQLHDPLRIKYYHDYLQRVLMAISVVHTGLHSLLGTYGLTLPSPETKQLVELGKTSTVAQWKGQIFEATSPGLLMDNFEWTNGFTVRFGIYYVDYKNNQARYPKSSAYWFQKILAKK